MSPARVTAAVAASAVVLAAVLPVTAALDPAEVLRARLMSGGLAVAVTVAVALVRGVRRVVWTSAAMAGIALGAAMLVRHVSATGACVATYAGRPVIVGRDFTAAGAEYVRSHPGVGTDDLLLDAGGAVDRLWTPASIASCRLWAGWAGLLAVPVFAAAVAAALAGRGLTLGAARGSGAAPTAAPTAASANARIIYDAFLSYRHVEPDRAYAEELVRLLEAQGLRAAIDVRDFAPNAHFLAEMERCIKESRFTLCVITSRYVDSDHTNEEAVIAKTLDLAQRTRRVVPLVYERVTLPVWLHGLSGIDFTEAARVDPRERLLALFTTPTP